MFPGMTTPTGSDDQGSSTRPYLIRALHDWCTDNGFTPYIAICVGPQVQVPREYVKNNEIVLNIGFDATSGLRLGNETIEFKARFGGVAREIVVPVDHVVAIYARENGQGMAFPVPAGGRADDDAPPAAADGGGNKGLRLAPAGESDAPADPGPEPDPPDPDSPPQGPGRPALKRIK